MKEEVYEVYRNKGIRLTAEMSPLLHKYFYASMKGKTWKGFHMFDKAHTVMLTEEGIIPKEVGVKILNALRQMEKDGAERVRENLGGHMHCGEAYVTQLEGPDVAGWIHCGRSSGDLMAVAYRVDARDILIELMKELIGIRETLVIKAEEHVDTVMPGYTHLQHAEPITFGFYLLAFLHQFERDFERAIAAYRHVNISPAGCAILTTTDFPINRKRTQDLMGFDSLFTNAKDAIWTMDFLAEFMAVTMGTTGILSRLADDLTIWHSSEFHMIEIPDAYCGTSSIMPQKKNPYGPEAIRGLNGDIVGYVTAFLAQTNRQSDSCEMTAMTPLYLYDAGERCAAALKIMNGIIKDLKVNKEVMKDRAGMFWAQATSLTNALVMKKKIPFRTAHQIIAILVRMAYEGGKTPKDVTPAMLDSASIEYHGKPVQLSEKDLREALDPEWVVRSKKVIGGTAPERVKEDIADSREKILADKRTLDQIEEKLTKAAHVLESAIEKIVA